jgi:hypothetical protein
MAERLLQLLFQLCPDEWSPSNAVSSRMRANCLQQRFAIAREK